MFAARDRQAFVSRPKDSFQLFHGNLRLGGRGSRAWQVEKGQVHQL